MIQTFADKKTQQALDELNKDLRGVKILLEAQNNLLCILVNAENERRAQAERLQAQAELAEVISSAIQNGKELAGIIRRLS